MDELADKIEAAHTPGPCALGVGCDEYGVCYADAHGQPEQCGKKPSTVTVDDLLNVLDDLLNSDGSRGIFHAFHCAEAHERAEAALAKHGFKIVNDET